MSPSPLHGLSLLEASLTSSPLRPAHLTAGGCQQEWELLNKTKRQASLSKARRWAVAALVTDSIWNVLCPDTGLALSGCSQKS